MRARRWAEAATVVALASACLASCNTIFGLADRPLAADASTGDAAALDAGPTDAGNPSCPADDAGYHDLATAGCWSTFATTSVSATATGCQGAAFDSRYVYLVPSPGGVALRYDTTADFGTASSWVTFDVAQAFGIKPAFAGAVFDGHDVTFVPAVTSTFVRFDTTSGFDDKSGWAAYDPNTAPPVTPNAAGYAGGAFDGRYLYAVPDDSTYLQRYDTTVAFTDPTSWAAVNINGADDAGPGFFGAAFDGRYVYMAPGTQSPDGEGILVRLDTKANILDESSFEQFDMTQVQTNAVAFRGAAFDGRYVYFAPSGLAGGDVVVTRFDSHGTLSDLHDWAAFNVTAFAKAAGRFFGAAFDGRFLYLVPWGTSASGANGLLVRYDTTLPFAASSSWSTFDTNAIGAAAFQGSVFDGRYLYLCPQSSGTVARFEARDPPAEPDLPDFYGSFF